VRDLGPPATEAEVSRQVAEKRRRVFFRGWRVRVRSWKAARSG